MHVLIGGVRMSVCMFVYVSGDGTRELCYVVSKYGGVQGKCRNGTGFNSCPRDTIVGMNIGEDVNGK